MKRHPSVLDALRRRSRLVFGWATLLAATAMVPSWASPHPGPSAVPGTCELSTTVLDDIAADGIPQSLIGLVYHRSPTANHGDSVVVIGQDPQGEPIQLRHYGYGLDCSLRNIDWETRPLQGETASRWSMLPQQVRPEDIPSACTPALAARRGGAQLTQGSKSDVIRVRPADSGWQVERAELSLNEDGSTDASVRATVVVDEACQMSSERVRKKSSTLPVYAIHVQALP